MKFRITDANYISADLGKNPRYSDYGKEMLRITDRNQSELLYGPIRRINYSYNFKDLKSYKDFPKLFIIFNGNSEMKLNLDLSFKM